MTVTKHITIAFAVATAAFLGLELSFNVYAIELKSTFNFTQTEVELISSAGVAGMAFSLVEVVVTETFGFRIGYLLIWMMSSGSALLLWISVIYKNEFSYWPIIAAFQFILSAGQNAGSSRLAAIAVTKVAKRNSGKVIGIFYASIAFAKLLYGTLLQHVFNNHLKNFFLCVFVLSAVSVGICALIHRPCDKSQESEDDEETTLVSNNNNNNNNNNNKTLSENEGSYSDLIKSRYFHLTFWPSAICYSVGFTLMNNITGIAQSTFFLHPVNIVYLLSLVIIVGRIIFGLLFDRFHSQNGGMGLMLVSSASVLVGIVFSLILFNTASVFILTTAVGLGMSGGLTIPCMLLSMTFGRRHFPFVVGCMYCMASVLSFLFQFLIGFVYDMRMSSGELCYGSQCFFVSFLVLLGAMIFTSVFQLLNLIKANLSPKRSEQNNVS